MKKLVINNFRYWYDENTKKIYDEDKITEIIGVWTKQELFQISEQIKYERPMISFS